MCSQACLVITCLSILTLLIMMGKDAAEKYFGNDVAPATDKSVNCSVIMDYVSNDVNNTGEALADKTRYQYMLETNRSCLLNGCATEHLSYGCCYKFPEVTFFICGNITYLPNNYGFNVTLRIGDAVYWEEVSLRNPPPVCLDTDILIPYKLGKLCLKIHNIDVAKKYVHFCVKLFVEILVKSVYDKELGCVDIPI